MDKQIPNTSTAWQLWHSDTFDRDAPQSLQASGTDILNGLYELWLCTLREGIQDNGNASFSSFHLTWGNTPSTRADVNVKPFYNSSLMKLRQWAGLTTRNPGEGRDTTHPGISVVSRLAQLHYELLEKSERWNAPAIDWSAEARELLSRVERMTDLEEL
jgi:hypothetical protein